MTDLAQKADTYAAKIELLTASPESDAMAQIAREARLLRVLLEKAMPKQTKPKRGATRSGS